nr:hypothetical protein [Candidatus Sigynarchaeota archaeon]
MSQDGNKEDSTLEQNRACPYCGKIIEIRPYWAHISAEHPQEYESSQENTWLPLYKDYATAGMDIGTILMVMSELFNTAAKEIEAFLIQAIYNEKIKAGFSDDAVRGEIAQSFGKDPAEIKKWLKK